jgi:hypothetical protein
MNRLLRFAAMAATLALLGGCIVAPAPYGPAYGYGYAPGYAYAPVYPAPVVGVGVGACFGCGRFHRW